MAGTEFLKLFPTLRSAGAAVVLGAALANPAGAIVLDDPNSGRSLLLPPSGAIGAWGSNASAVAIGPNHVLTTRHQEADGSTATPTLRQVTLGGTTYNSVSQTLFDPAGETWDVRLIEIENTDGSPANLTDFLPVYTPAIGESLVGQRVVLAAHGVPGVNETAQGFDWAPFDAQTPANSYGLSYGENVIDSLNTENNSNFNGGPRFVADFDGPADAGRLNFEASVAPGDSGGAALLYRYDQWWLVGLPNNVEFDNSGTVPEAFFGQEMFFVDVTGMGSDIETAIGGGFAFPVPKPLPEPAAASALALLALLGRRRR